MENIYIPLIPQHELKEYDAPTCVQIDAARTKASKYLLAAASSDGIARAVVLDPEIILFDEPTWNKVICI